MAKSPSFQDKEDCSHRQPKHIKYDMPIIHTADYTFLTKAATVEFYTPGKVKADCYVKQ